MAFQLLGDLFRCRFSEQEGGDRGGIDDLNGHGGLGGSS